MGKLNRLQNRLVKIQTAITIIENEYPGILEYKAMSADMGTLGNTSQTNQDFAPVMDKYISLMTLEENIEEQIDSISGNQSCTSGVYFNR